MPETASDADGSPYSRPCSWRPHRESLSMYRRAQAPRHSPSTAAASPTLRPPADINPRAGQASAGARYRSERRPLPRRQRRNQILRPGASGEVRGGRGRRPTGILRRRRIPGPCRTPSRRPGTRCGSPAPPAKYPAHGPPQFRLPHDAARPSPPSPRQRTEPAHMRSPAGPHQPKRKQKIVGVILRLAVRGRRAARDAASSWAGLPAATGKVCGARDCVEGCMVTLSAVSKACDQPRVPTGRHRRGLPAETCPERTN